MECGLGWTGDETEGYGVSIDIGGGEWGFIEGIASMASRRRALDRGRAIERSDENFIGEGVAASIGIGGGCGDKVGSDLEIGWSPHDSALRIDGHAFG